MKITHNIFRIQDDNSIMCRFNCIPSIEHMLLDYTNLFYPNENKKNGKIIYNYFQENQYKP